MAETYRTSSAYTLLSAHIQADPEAIRIIFDTYIRENTEKFDPMYPPQLRIEKTGPENLDISIAVCGYTDITAPTLFEILITPFFDADEKTYVIVTNCEDYEFSQYALDIFKGRRLIHAVSANSALRFVGVQLQTGNIDFNKKGNLTWKH